MTSSSLSYTPSPSHLPQSNIIINPTTTATPTTTNPPPEDSSSSIIMMAKEKDSAGLELHSTRSNPSDPSATAPATATSTTAADLPEQREHSQQQPPRDHSEAIGGDIGAELHKHKSRSKKQQHDEDAGVSLTITLLLTNGARHPFEITSRYLAKRNVDVDDYNPFNMSVYTLKELILKEWRSDWEARPASPTSIRLISFGKLLDDKMPLSECKFNRDAPNVVHMTLRPPSLVEEDPANNASKTAKAGVQRSSHEGNERTPGCRCVIL